MTHFSNSLPGSASYSSTGHYGAHHSVIKSVTLPIDRMLRGRTGYRFIGIGLFLIGKSVLEKIGR